MLWNVVMSLATVALDAGAHLISGHIVLSGFGLFVLGLMNPWDPQTAPLRNDTNIYDNVLTNEGWFPSDLSSWNMIQLDDIARNGGFVQTRDPATGAQLQANNSLLGVDNEGRPRATPYAGGNGVFGTMFSPSGFKFGGGAGPSGGAGPGSSASGLAGTSTGFGPSSLGLTGGGTGATGGALGGANAAGGVAAGAGAGGASGGFWGAAKGVLGNKALMSGLISGLSSAYGQWQQKSLAKDQYKYQSQELERYRQWQADQAEKKRNSPSAQMSRALLQYYMPIMVERLGRHGRGGDTSALQEAMRNILGQGA